MGLGDGDWFVCTVVLATLLGAHALVDAICTVATLFPNLRWNSFRSIYPSVFKHSHVREVFTAYPTKPYLNLFRWRVLGLGA